MSNSTGAAAGETGQKIPLDIPIWMAISAFTAVAWYNVAELNIQVFMTFKRHRGLYFWSLIVSSYGCVLHSLGFLIKFFEFIPNEAINDYFACSVLTVGWYCMVTGQAVVLYSRLHLVVRDDRVLRAVLTMIIVDAICLHLPTTVLTFGSNSNKSAEFTKAFSYMERIQMTMFCIQEFIISGIYVYATIRLLRPVYHNRIRKVMMQLIWINCIIIAMDVVLLAMEYGGNYEIEATLKAMVYSIKLKLEFAVLNQLMTLANSTVNNAANLSLHDEEEQCTTPGPKGRSKSISYLTRHIHYPNRKETSDEHGSDGHVHSADLPSTPSSCFTGNTRRLKWIPSLDRKAVIETEHIEKASATNNIFTNPAACFPPERGFRFPPHDGLGGIPSPTSPLSPTLTGSTLDHGHEAHHLDRSNSRRAPPPPRLDTGILRSDRPSVSDWAHGPDSIESATSSEARLDPCERSAPPDRDVPARVARPIAEQSMGMDFMTSALGD
ncbi:hypothetical protein MMC20_001601 [Loxospora ochrophaea]|nr:hypothetical protein [Loxospora ochrophaea]